MYNQLNLFDDSEQVIASPLEILKSQPPIPHPSCPAVVAYGGGKNSTAMLIMLTKLGVKVDLILFADTGGELPETYRFIQVFSQWLAENGQPPITVVRQSPSGVSDKRSVLIASKANLLKCLFGKRELLGWLIWWCGVTAHAPETLEEASLVTQTLPSKAYGKSACSVQWKIRPQNEYVDRWQPAINAWGKGLKVRKLIGYHRDEISRLLDKKTRQMRPLQDDQYIYEYPLMTHGIDEMGCRAIITSVGLSVPPKSSCFFCPNRSASEVEALPEELRLRGELIEQVNVDGIHHRESSVKGLGRKFAWRDIGQMTELEKLMAQPSRQCQCID